MKRTTRAALALAPLLAVCACTSTPSTPSTPPGPSGTPARPVSTVAPPEGLTQDQNERVPAGATWSEHYFPSTDGVELHADVLLPEGLTAGEQVPVILMVGPYFAHAGMAAPEGHKTAGPSGRFVQLIEEGRVFENGYAMVTRYLRG